MMIGFFYYDLLCHIVWFKAIMIRDEHDSVQWRTYFMPREHVFPPQFFFQKGFNNSIYNFLLLVYRVYERVSLHGNDNIASI